MSAPNHSPSPPNGATGKLTASAPGSGERLVTLSTEQLERLADLIADRLRAPAPTSSPLVGAAELAERLDVDPKTVYRHADDLGAVRVGRALRFAPERALAVWATRGRSLGAQAQDSPAPTGRKRGRTGAATAGHCQLLPVGRKNDRNKAR